MGVGGTQLRGMAGGLGEVGSAIRRYTGDGGQHLVSQLRSNRHMLRFASTQVLHPVRMKTAVRAYADALRRQEALFLNQQVDGAVDAMRHAGASALVVDRLVQRGVKPTVAGEFMRRLGRAHELDSELTGLHRAYSEAMDLHNNELGIGIAIDHARRGASGRAGEQALEGAVLRALADGRGLMLDARTTPPRPTTLDDLNRVLRTPLAGA